MKQRYLSTPAHQMNRDVHLLLTWDDWNLQDQALASINKQSRLRLSRPQLIRLAADWFCRAVVNNGMNLIAEFKDRVITVTYKGEVIRK